MNIYNCYIYIFKSRVCVCMFDYIVIYIYENYEEKKQIMKRGKVFEKKKPTEETFWKPSINSCA